MFLRRLFYKTALEVANTNGVVLFHDAGFSPTLAFELLGEQAETVPAQRTVDVLLSLGAAELDALLPVVAVARASAPGYRLIDNLVRYRSSDAGVGIGGRTAPGGAPAEQNTALDQLLSSTGLPLLGHAVLRARSEAVHVLLGLGANARAATLPLAGIGALPPRFDLLAVDPFLFVAQEDGMDPTRRAMLLEHMQAAGWRRPRLRTTFLPNRGTLLGLVRSHAAGRTDRTVSGTFSAIGSATTKGTCSASSRPTACSDAPTLQGTWRGCSASPGDRR